MSQLEKIRATFFKKGYRENSRISPEQFIHILSELKGRPFDQDIAFEIWDRAQIKSDQKVDVYEISTIIEQGQDILSNKLTEVQQNIENLTLKRKQIEVEDMGQQQKNRQLKNINLKLQELNTQRFQYERDLLLITEPFGIDFSSVRDKKIPTIVENFGQNNRFRRILMQQNEELQRLFYIVLIMSVIEVVVMYKKYDFLNLLVLVTTMSIFMLNYFDNTYLKLCGGLAGTSIFVDFIWLILYGGSFWSPSSLSELNSSSSVYMKSIVLLTIINIAAKAYLIYLILKQRNIEPTDDFTINPFQGVSLNVVANHTNIVTKAFKQKQPYL